MIIKRLSLHNFGVYAGTNSFVFNNEKPIVLIGGLNGRGKTTFLEAVLLSLYGSNSFAYSESSFSTYGKYLRSFVNTSDGSRITYVEMEFILSSIDQDTYIVHREWNGNGDRTREKVVVFRNNERDSFLSENWPMFIESILPSALSNFFFFDGEKIAELAVDDTDTKVKESIRSMLGITVIDTLNNDLLRLINRKNKVVNNDDVKRYEHLRMEKEQAEQALLQCDQEIQEVVNLISSKNEELEKTNIEYTAKGGDVIEKKQEYVQERAYLSAAIDQEYGKMLEYAAGAMPLNLVADLLGQALEKGKIEKEKRVLSEVIRTTNQMYEEFKAIKPSQEVQSFIEFINNKTAALTPSEFDISDAALYQMEELCKTGLITVKNAVNASVVEVNNLKDQAALIDSYLSIDINEKSIQKLYKRIKTLELEIIELKVKHKALVQNRSTLNGTFIKKNAEYKKFADKILDEMEANDDFERTIKYAQMARKIIDEYSIRLQARKVEVLARTITECYKRLANKKTLIDRILMDPESLDLHYINEKEKAVPKEKLSAGEKQLMVISILWALAICSKKKLPVIIDTPLSRLDSEHRTALITTYFPNASDQTIILSTDTEIDKNYYDLMKKDIGDEFCLLYDDASKSTSIVEGYFYSETE